MFELMVQLKSQEINFSRERNDAEKTQREYLDRLETETNRTRILENVIEDKKAELSVLVSDKTSLNEQVDKLREANEALERRRAEDAKSSNELKSEVEKLVREYVRIEESFRVAAKRLSQLDQRVEFAKNRLGVVKALYAAQSNKQQRQINNHQHTGNSLNTISMLSTIHGSANLNEAQISSLNVLEGERNRAPEMDEERFSVYFF